MRRRGISVGVICAFAGVASCSSESDSPGGSTPATGGTATTGGVSSTGGTTGGAKATGGTAPTGGAKATGGTGAGGAATGGSMTTGGSKAMAGAGGTGGAGGSMTTGGSKAMAGAGGKGDGGATAGSGGATGGGPSGGAGGGASAMMNFFVTSDTSKTGNLGGLEKADARCQALAAAVGAGSKTWRAYLSTEDPVVNAADRIGPGPYYNSKGEELAADKAALHKRTGDAALFLDEKGAQINGQWKGSPTPNEHDILTGSTRDGMVSKGNTCDDWTGTTGNSQVGHSDGLGPNMKSDEPFSLWTGSHTGQCGDTEPGGGAGRIYCFVGP